MLRFAIIAAAVVLLCLEARAVILASTADPTFNTTEPTGDYAGSGWQFEGQWNGFIGTPIAPDYFVAADHIGGPVGGTFIFQGVPYTTDNSFRIPDTDLRLWHVTSTFPSYAPIYRGSDETGKDLVVFGTGTQRGAEVLLSSTAHGWLWGTGDGVQRWGTNTVATVTTSGDFGPLISATFTPGDTPFEAHLSTGDSSGGVFIKDVDGIWKLAGVNFGVDGPYYPSILGGDPFNAALFDQTGFFERESAGVFLPLTGPGSFYASRISTNAQAIDAITGVPEPNPALALACAFILISACRTRRSQPE